MTADYNEGPAVALSFANNFWGKDDAGVGPLLERMANAKLTCDELKNFYSARASIEDDYARKLLSLCRKNLGSQETGTLRHSLDIVRAEVESMGKQHQHIAQQMKSELEEPLAAFAGGMKERRKIVQNTVEKLLKTKVQQTQMVNKTRDKYEQECLKIKGYLAQGHMVMGQEERKNKAKLEKTQISLAASNAEYEAAVRALEETTARWNREWKAAADKFQDLEEERLDFTKSSLWQFANIASTVCVSDDSSCEKIRLSLEHMEVEKDIITFITEKGTGQEIPDAPKYINFCRGDMDAQSEVSDDDNYSVAQFSRSINPAFRSSSPQPSTFESHHDPNSALARKLHGDPEPPRGQAAALPQKAIAAAVPVIPQQDLKQDQRRVAPRGYQSPQASNMDYDPNEFAPVPHDPYPMDGMTMLCRPTASDLSTAPSATSARPSSRGSHSETSFSSQEPPQQAMAPVKQQQQQQQPPAQQRQPPPQQQQQPLHQLQHHQQPQQGGSESPDKKVLKKKSGFFGNNSPFRRKSTKEVAPNNNNRNTWHPSNNQRPQLTGAFKNDQVITPDRSVSPDPIAANASLALNVGGNVFQVDDTARQKQQQQGSPATPEDDPIAMALAELKGVTSGSNKLNGGGGGGRVSADHYHGIATPAPGGGRSGAMSVSGGGNSAVVAAMRGTPPPSYDQQVQVQRLGVPPPAVTSKAMKAASEKFQTQTRSLFDGGRPGSGGGGGGVGGDYARSMSRPGTRGNDTVRAASPAPTRSASPRPGSRASPSVGYGGGGSASPNMFGSSTGSQHQGGGQQQRGSVSSHHSHGQSQHKNSSSSSYSGRYDQQQQPGRGSPSVMGDGRSASPAPYSNRPASSMSGHQGNHSMALSVAGSIPTGAGEDGGGSLYGGSQRGRHGRSNTAGNVRAGSSGNVVASNMSLYEGSGGNGGGSRARSKSVAAGGAGGRDRQVGDPGTYTRDGRAIMHFARALYMYQAAIPEELGFAKGDVLAVLRHQDDGWWEATVQGGNGQVGLVPSNYLQPLS
ncbi:putative septation protein [Cercophora samala]|uniref:Septation protein n=1 Tax=Cercophora samala TaxID=330535 RepID=A0AA40DDW4_9PEZI|nr:putative septation protein [Cercophora samala]